MFFVQVGTTLDATQTTMEEVASQMISKTEVDNGDSITFEFKIDLPSVAVEDRSDLNIEIFVMNPSVGKSQK